MWPFTSKTAPATDRRLVERLEDLERRVEALDVEWTEWYDKYRRLYARIAKRVERDADAGQEGTREATGAPKPPAATGVHQHRPPRNLRGF